LADDILSKIAAVLLESPTEIWVGSVLSAEKNQSYCQSAQRRWELQPTLVESQAEGYGVRSAYSQPGDLGNDRWLAMIAARARYKQATLVVDLGTAATVDALDRDGQHLGGQILPGYNAIIHSLNQSTDGVDAAAFTGQDHYFASGTQDGVTMGVLSALGAWVDRAAEQQANSQEETVCCLLTGGDAGILVPYIRTECEHVPDLVLQGLSVVAGGNA
jgi:type III pantothenate kinase